jgi:dolichol-phosphate mannosyltransferase|tara:strand:+ start:4070 stop:4861 length:792 start_codon:yes stop_codon:yes gene_type:complete
MKESYNNIGVSLILPTLNEADNLKILIPEIIDNLPKNLSKFEIIVVDDNSTDDTEKVVNKLIDINKQIRLIKRESPKSLPLSILEGIKKSIYENVLWLDADGSMPATVVAELIKEGIASPSSVIIGSRFVDGGGYKGTQIENKNIFTSIRNIYQSEDSVAAVFLSKLFNTFLYRVINSDIKDVTSGFILGKKEYFKDYIFTNASYGDYFVYLIKELKFQNIEMKEVGYICLTRKYGTSKSGTSLKMLLKRAIPYFKAAIFDIK